MTKSGRQVQKPTQFNPTDTASAQKRKHYGKRTVEQALCKVCTRGLSPNMNQIVFCDGCNFCWHQMCHEPYIDDDFVSNETRSWFCGRCLAKREKALARKKTLSEHKGVSWAAKGADQVSCICSACRQYNHANPFTEADIFHQHATFPTGQPPNVQHRATPRAPHLPRSRAGGVQAGCTGTIRRTCDT